MEAKELIQLLYGSTVIIIIFSLSAKRSCFSCKNLTSIDVRIYLLRHISVIVTHGCDLSLNS